MLSFADLAARPDFTVSAVTCRDDHKGWSEQEAPGFYRLVLVRQGRFRRRTAGRLIDADAAMGYFGVPGEEEHFAHPAGGDVCTLITLTPGLWQTLAGEGARVNQPAVYIEPRLDLVHRRLLGAAHDSDVDYAVAEQLLQLLDGTIEQVVKTPVRARPAADSALVLAARALIADDHPATAGLLPLAGLLTVSPYRLSRAFTRELGVSLTHYRNRVRLGRAMDRLEGGEVSLAALAADLGFADQAHLCRTVVRQLGHTPTALRRLLASAPS